MANVEAMEKGKSGPAAKKKRSKWAEYGDLNDDGEVDYKDYLFFIAEHKYYTVIMTLWTIYALFGDDIRVATTWKQADSLFYSLSVVALILFCLEVALCAIAKPGYFWGFYFWLDVVSTLSLIPDIGWIWDPIVGTDTGGDDAAAIKAGRASRAGTKAGRVVRIVRLVRMVRIVKLYKASVDFEDEEDDEMLKDIQAQVNAKPSKIGTKLTEMTTRRVIILVLVCIIGLPQFDGFLNNSYNQYQEFGLKALHRLAQDYNTTGDITTEFFNKNVEQYARDAGRLMYLEICSNCAVAPSQADTKAVLVGMKFQPLEKTLTGSDTKYVDTAASFSESKDPLTMWSADLLKTEAYIQENYRADEAPAVIVGGCFKAGGLLDTQKTDCVSKAYFDAKSETEAGAALNLVKTIFVMFVLAGGAILFTQDAQDLVITPIERMMLLIQKLSENPLGNTGQAHLEEEEEKGENMETALLEATLSKIGGLLQIGFGAAGSEIIAKNMQGGGELNVMIQGKKVTCVFGFGIIGNFTETCACLEERICMYINTIAAIVHNDVHDYYGAANKNIGSAFLCAWKICDGALFGLRDPRDEDQTPFTEEERRAGRDGVCMMKKGAGRKDRRIVPQEMVDSAVCSFIKCRVDLHHANNSARLLEFLRQKKMQKHFGNSFKVHMGFGMHIGWAIEGAIGSKFKIDASYLSPNVNMSARLEAATHQFNTDMLMSGWLVQELSPEARDKCRLIDRICVVGSKIPMDLYTFDINSYPDDVLQPRFDDRGRQIKVNFGTDLDFIALQKGVDPSFYDVFKEGVQAYLDGEWPKAKEILEKAQKLKPGDGPTESLMNVMNATDFNAPMTWKGYRQLTSK